MLFYVAIGQFYPGPTFTISCQTTDTGEAGKSCILQIIKAFNKHVSLLALLKVEKII